jgi:hypothetical protein
MSLLGCAQFVEVLDRKGRKMLDPRNGAVPIDRRIFIVEEQSYGQSIENP